RPFAHEARLRPASLRIAYAVVTPNGLAVDPACRAAAARTAERLEALGHRVEAAAPDWSDEGLVESFVNVYAAGSGVFAGENDVSLIDPVEREGHATDETTQR